MFPLLLLDLEKEAPPADHDAPSDSDDVNDPERVVRCATCDHEVARFDDRFAQDGRAEHVFTNPGGYTFVIGCWRQAAGCVGIGEESTEWSWFPGCAWRVAVCRKCTAQLGWLFRGDDVTFAGLILNRIVQ
jgi:hypothetical protein